MRIFGTSSHANPVFKKYLSTNNLLILGLTASLIAGCGGSSTDQSSNATANDANTSETSALDTTATDTSTNSLALQETDDSAQLSAAVSVSPILEQNIFGAIFATITSATEQNGPIEGATVNLNEADTGNLIATLTTNASGTVSFSNLPAGTFYVLEVNHPNYVVKSHLLETALAASDTTNLNISMLRRADPVIFNEDQGGSITAGTAQIILPANAFVTADSNAEVTGDVTVYVTPIDPTNSEHMSAYPGTLLAQSSDGGDRELFTYGVYDIDFYNNNQEYLALKSGVTAELVLPLFTTTHEDGSEIAAGDTIPLWRLNEQNGKWVFESEAVVEQGDTGLVLRGPASGFSAYNMDRPSNRNYWNVINAEFDLIDSSVEFEDSLCLAVRYYHRHAGQNTHYSDDVICVNDTDYKQHYALRNGWISEYCWDIQVLKPGVTTFNWSNQNVIQSSGTTNVCWADPYARNECQHLSGNSVLNANHCGTLSDHIGFNMYIDLLPDGTGNYNVSVSSLKEGLRLNDPSVISTRASLQ